LPDLHTVAAIGFLFDTYELLLLPLIAAPAIAEILQVPANNPIVTNWVGRLLWLAALSGGVFVNALLLALATTKLTERHLSASSQLRTVEVHSEEDGAMQA